VPLRRAVTAAQAVALLAIAARLARGRRRHPALGPAPPPAGTISVVVPARDEERRLGPCLDGLRDDPDLTEVIVVDDCSSDGTAAVARAAGARVLAGAELPAGWVGKAWALHQGLRAARGDWVVFLDADARPRPGLLRALVHAGGERVLVSGGPRFRCDGAAERALHASMLATIVLRAGPGDAVGWEPPPSRAIANGQCLAARRADLLAAGGWERVRGHLTEDVALARALRADGWSVRLLDAADLLAVQMYESLAQTWTGWGRSLAGVDVNPPAILAADLAALWLAMGLPLARVAAGRATALDGAALAMRLALVPALARSYSPRGAPFWLSPLADPATLVRLTQSALRPSRTWRGRTY
jgi:dolichol-phosphate mannosyltransferase